MATEHLLSQGRQRLAYVGDTWSGSFVDQRIQGFRDAHDAAGIEVDERLILRCENRWDDPPFTFKELDELLAKGVRFDGMFCEYDRMAGPALRSIRKAGLMVPGDVAVVGYDDEESAKLMGPPLTTIRQPYEELCALAVSQFKLRLGPWLQCVERSSRLFADVSLHRDLTSIVELKRFRPLTAPGA